MKKLFLIIGAPGSGKTTDAEILAKQSGGVITHFSTGDLLREETAKGTALGQEIEKYTSKGNLVPLQIVVNTIITAISNATTDVIIIDGYPRSEEQLDALDMQLKASENIKLVSVIEVEVSEGIAKERVLGRARGDDDNAEVFYNRMKVYLAPLAYIEDFYSKAGILSKVDGSRSIEAIVADISEIIQSKI